MSEAEPRSDPEESSQALRRGLVVRLAVATAALLAIAALALALLVPTRSTTEAAKPPVAASLAPAPIPDLAPSSSPEPDSPPQAETAVAEDSASSAAALQAQSAAAGANSESPGAAVAGAPIAADPAPAETAQGKAGATKSASSAHAVGIRPARGPHLQAGVFLQPANAQALKATLEAQGVPVYIESRVHIGPFRDRKEAERMREKLKELGHSTVLVTQ